MKRVILISLISANLLQANFTRDETLEVVNDSSTNLMWQDNADVSTNKKSYTGAITYCNNLNFKEYDDWRLPSVRELLTITDMSKYKPAINENFKNLGDDLVYWSSTAHTVSSSAAWQVYFDYGFDFLGSKTDTYFVRCVRGNSLDDLKNFNRDDTLEVVTDNSTSLMWQDNSEVTTNTQNWQNANDYCDDLEFAGYDDWRLPAISELRGVVDYSRSEPAIFKTFKSKNSELYWSSSSDNEGPSYSWIINFKSGEEQIYPKTSNYYLRCVRGTATSAPTPTPTSPIEPTPTPSGEPTPTPTSSEGLCEIPKNSLKIVDMNKCELKDEWQIGDTVTFQFFYKNKLGQEFPGSVYDYCAVKNSDVAIFNNVKSEISFREDGIASLTCVYNEWVARHQFFVGDYEKGINSAIVVVGKGSENDKLKEAFVYLGNEVYMFLHSQGYSDDEVMYFNSFGEQKLFDNDLDGVKDNVVDKIDYTFDDFKNAILEMPESTNPLLIYLIDHGLKGGNFLIDPDKKILANEFDKVLDEFQENTKRKVVIIVDSCYSGAFVETLKDENRVVISSGTADQTIPMSTSGISFTNYFIKNLQDKKTLKDSFDNAYKSYRKIAKNTFPQADFSDEITANKPFGFFFNAAADVIKDFTGKSALKLAESTRQKFSLRVDPDSVIGVDNSKAYVTLTPPQTVTINPDSQDVIEIKSEKIPLVYQPSSSRGGESGEFVAEYDLNQLGYYEAVYEIVDEAKDKIISDSVTIQVGESNRGVEFVESNEITLDIQKGWNLVALPTNQNLDNPLNKFNNPKDIYTFKSNNWTHNPTKIEYGQGFWINSTEFNTYTFSGSSYKNNLNIDSGWSLLGTGEDITVNGLSFSQIWVYRNSTWLNKDELNQINAKEGFWIKE